MSETMDVSFDILDTTSRLVTKDIYKLNIQAFLLSNCPHWAKYAAVDYDGIASWFSIKPILGPDSRWQLPKGALGNYTPIEHAGDYMRFDAEDYERSIVEKKACFDFSRSVTEKQRLRYVLNEKVFDLPMCPSWARYAVVTRSGECVLTAKKPSITSGTNWEFAGRAVLLTGFLFDREHYRTGCVARSRKPKVRKDNA